MAEAWNSLRRALAQRGASESQLGASLSYNPGEIVEAAKLYEQARGSAVVVVVVLMVMVVVVVVVVVVVRWEDG